MLNMQNHLCMGKDRTLIDRQNKPTFPTTVQYLVSAIHIPISSIVKGSENNF